MTGFSGVCVCVCECVCVFLYRLTQIDGSVESFRQRTGRAIVGGWAHACHPATSIGPCCVPVWAVPLMELWFPLPQRTYKLRPNADCSRSPSHACRMSGHKWTVKRDAPLHW